MTACICFVFGALTLVGALGVVLARNPVHSALSLVVTLVSVAVLFIQQDAHLLAAVQVVVYAGAIVVLFLFVIMLLGVDHPDTLRDPLKAQRVAAIVIGVVLLVEVLFLTGHQWATGSKAPASDAIRGGQAGLGNNVERVARSLFTDFLWPFEITAALLVLAVIGAVVLARRSRHADEALAEEVS
jgi:NADH-quinone oxidoreductase subunit J